eukprot:gnl/TRDRNA2_/TRDRNA2_75694_c1_seq1.p1 gnl/TRDRNA2_/TRDRNA2_75694_c1~~gnl/TRDRNA2_/TRDRNA2_75694_c1_seq1.p1  ORF type:complete len:397 (-),score=72.38 gnl/TRDRNA2_/TRDRNA2_75694_c1_seq1:28-1218(-)
MMESGIRPVYVFDGKPPELKLQEIAARQEKKQAADKALEDAKERGDDEEVQKQVGRTVRVSKEMTAGAKKLLRLMGLPIVEAPCEAEACCAGLCKAGLVYAAVTEDADCLTFGTPILIRNLLRAESAKISIYEINLDLALQQLDLTMDQFIDFCILSGCDYCDTIRGVGQSTAIKLLVQHGSLEKVIESLNPAKSPIPPRFPYKEARELFKSGANISALNVTLEWKPPDLQNLKKFLVDNNSFREERVDRLLQRLKAARGKARQSNIERFFTRPATAISESEKFDPSKSNKKKANDSKKRAAPKSKAKATPTKKAKGSFLAEASVFTHDSAIHFTGVHHIMATMQSAADRERGADWFAPLLLASAPFAVTVVGLRSLRHVWSTSMFVDRGLLACAS